MRDDSISASSKPKSKWYTRPLTVVFAFSVVGINTAITNAKTDPSWILRTLFLFLAGGVAFAVWYSGRSVKRGASGASPKFDIVKELGQTLGTSPRDGYVVPNESAPPISWTLALVFQAVSLVFGVIYDIMKLCGEDSGGGAFIVPVLIAAVFTVLVSAILHYRCWQALPAKYARTTPGKAVGCMFIPFYNFYWAFISFVALPRGFVARARDSGNEPASDPTALGIAMAVLFICSLTIGIVPGFASVLEISSFAVWILYYRQIIPLANAAMKDAGDSVYFPILSNPTKRREEPLDPDICSTQLPPGAPPIPKPTVFIYKDGQSLGPFTLPQVRGKVKSGEILESDLAWQEGYADWVTAAEALKTPPPGAAPPASDFTQ